MIGRIVVGPTDAAVYAPLALRDTVRALPWRRWDRAQRCWRIPARGLVDDAVHDLRAAGCDRVYRGWEPGATSWADEFCLAVGPTQLDAIRRGLPGIFGDDDPMAADLADVMRRAISRAMQRL